MSRFALKPTHKPVREYYDGLAKFAKLGVKHESAVRSAFQELLDHCARKFDWKLVPEFRAKGKGGKQIAIDGALLDNYGLNHGLWEAKDSDDDLEKEIKNSRREFNLPKFSALGTIRPRINGRCLFKYEMFEGHGCHSVEGQQRHRTETCVNSSCPQDQKLAATPEAAGKSRFRLSRSTPNSVCGQLLLVWVSEASAKAGQQPRLLVPQTETLQKKEQSGFKAGKRRALCHWTDALRKPSMVARRIVSSMMRQ